ncbi:MAG: hypothetical protein ABGZ17_20645, partial [Planctomycetaceae bacterium]
LLPGSSLGGNAWVTLQSTLEVEENATLVVTVTGLSDGNLAADGVRLERAVLPALRTLDLRRNPLDNRSRDLILPTLQSERPGQDDPSTAETE